MIKVASPWVVWMGFLSLSFSGSAIAQLPSAPPAEIRTETALVSPETGLNYQPLQKLLLAGQWRAANELTGQLMQQAVKRDRQGWVRTDDIAVFPCWDLQTIDNLWKEASQGHFGFSAQFPIYLATGNKPGRLVATDSYDDFGDRIGWRQPSNNPDRPKEAQWIAFKENLNFSLAAPVGHLPNPRQEYQVTGGRLQYTALAKRLVECKVVSLPTTNTANPVKILMQSPENK